MESATVILTDNNAYVGVVLNKKADGTEIKEGSEELDELYAKIRKELSMTNANVKNVYISINPEFVARMKDYGKKIEEGKPVEGLFEEFSELVKRVFPTLNTSTYLQVPSWNPKFLKTCTMLQVFLFCF